MIKKGCINDWAYVPVQRFKTCSMSSLFLFDYAINIFAIMTPLSLIVVGVKLSGTLWRLAGIIDVSVFIVGILASLSSMLSRSETVSCMCHWFLFLLTMLSPVHWWYAPCHWTWCPLHMMSQFLLDFYLLHQLLHHHPLCRTLRGYV